MYVFYVSFGETTNYFAMPILIGNIVVFLVINPYGAYIKYVIMYHLFSDFALRVIAVSRFPLTR
ncbi:MAG: hypothetical protein QXR19_02970 [Candidatus Jordarchaeaceae archaeon]